MLQIRISERIYIKDPESSDLGKKIVEEGLVLIDEIGFEQFTFKKLASKIRSTEASIYRYFENKHKLLIYLVSWYWSWLEYLLVFSTNNIVHAEERLSIAFRVITRPFVFNTEFDYINGEALHRVVVAESPKAYLSKEVDEDNKEGYFLGYKRLCKRVSELASEIAPDYPYPASLVSTLIESAHHQAFFSAHLPRLTDVPKNDLEALNAFLCDTALRVLKSYRHNPGNGNGNGNGHSPANGNGSRHKPNGRHRV
ncbi:MAG: TetR/AcrR family transcriptional regulator [Bacteroidia bacterium]|nr:TetR/AcrR family transcriptional regulator [Bacteroidia bacterium]